MARKFWTPTDLENLKTHYPDNRTADLLPMFPGRTTVSINSAAFVYDLKKSEAYHAKGLGGRISKGSRNSIGSEFRKGMVPHNKGKKITEWMSAENIENSKKGCFKKGNISHNTLPIGSERITKDGYIEVKVRHSDNLQHNNNYEFKHRVLWQYHNGPIPEGMIVIIKTGNKTNFTINDLEMITKRENVIRNGRCDTAIVKKFLGIKDAKTVEKIIAEMPGIIELKRTNLSLNTQIQKR